MAASNTCFRALLVILTMSVSTCLALVATGKFRLDAAYGNTLYTAEQMPVLLSAIQQASSASTNSSELQLQGTQTLFYQNNAVLRQMAGLQQNVTSLTQALVTFVNLLVDYQTPGG